MTPAGRGADGRTPPYRGLIVDFAGVLTTPLGASVREWCARQGLPADSWRRALVDDPAGRALYGELELGRLSQREWNRRTAELIGAGVEPEDLMGRAHAGVRAAPAMVGLVRAARAAGLSVALLSNSYGLDPYNPYTVTGVWDLFDVRVISGEVGLAKPDPGIYRLTLERLGLPGGACVFVDDHFPNLGPAEELGITTVHADGPGAARAVARLLGLP
ncbi:HAD-IA family hydrolase [Kitasatospora sp. NPDC056327]|uniref:HAD-IA family hydrolase n=1 Tax=Kitasatospora sp. NPDC056327 TaxID=3345785 RepID=UPI0035D9EF19